MDWLICLILFITFPKLIFSKKTNCEVGKKKSEKSVCLVSFSIFWRGIFKDELDWNWKEEIWCFIKISITLSWFPIKGGFGLFLKFANSKAVFFFFFWKKKVKIFLKEKKPFDFLILKQKFQKYCLVQSFQKDEKKDEILKLTLFFKKKNK